MLSMNTVICFFFSLCFGIQFGRRFVLKTTKKLKCFVLKTKVSNLVLAARVVEKT